MDTMPTKKKKRAAFVLGMTDDWAFAAATVLYSLADHKPTVEHDVIIFYSDMTERNRELLNEIYPCKFIKFDNMDRIRKETRRGSRMRFARFDCFPLLEEYEVVAWLDSDILIRKDITGLIRHYPNGIAMYRYPASIPVSNSYVKPIEGYDLSVPAFASGTLVLSDDLREPEKIREWCYQKVNEWADYASGDQAIFNVMLQEFQLEAFPLDESYCRHPKDGIRGAKILHPWYRRKFWDHTIYPQWDEYYRKWLALGGTGPELPHKVKRLIYRIGWLLARPFLS